MEKLGRIVGLEPHVVLPGKNFKVCGRLVKLEEIAERVEQSSNVLIENLRTDFADDFVFQSLCSPEQK